MAEEAQQARQARKWKRELNLSSKREKDFRENGDKIIKRYRGEEKKRNRYNVLWATSETLRPAIYNSKPQPDVRRRFRDADPLGKAVSETLERSLHVLFDSDEPDKAIKNDLLDSLLPGRGVSVIRYVPKLAPEVAALPASKPDEKRKESDESVGSSAPPEPREGVYEQLEDEQVAIEHVDWRDYREGYGRTWEEIPWVAFRHKLIRPDAEAKFGKAVLAGVKFAQGNTDDPKKPTDQYGDTAKVAEFWEFWDKEDGRVFFLHEGEGIEHLFYPLDNLDGEPPLKFEGFFPCPDPLMLVENTGSRIPIPPFHLYEEQANELDQVSQRIDRIIKICRLRGIYDVKLVEVADLLAGDDNELTPVQNAQAWADKGLDAAIAWMPIEQAEKVLAALYNAREQQKRIIDELTGVSDIVRGATDPTETATAQELKGAYHSIRLSRMQRELQRYARDLMRLAAQVMANEFSAETFARMTDLNFPTAEQKALAQAQLQQMAAAAAANGQPPQPPDPKVLALLQQPSWEDIIGLMRSPAMRQFRIDVETDSTVAMMLQSDMLGLAQVLKAITETVTGMAPLVISQALPIDAAKEVVMAVIRRARMGTAVEDAFDKMQAPQPQPNTAEAGRAQAAQANAAATVQKAQIEAQSDQTVQQMRQEFETQRIQMVEQAKNERELFREQIKNERVSFEQRWDAAVKIIIATIQATKSSDTQAGPLAEAEYRSAQ